jgi:hypothetical protein
MLVIAESTIRLTKPQIEPKKVELNVEKSETRPWE